MRNTWGGRAPDTPAHHRRMAAFYDDEAAQSVHADWAQTLREWAAERLARAAELEAAGPAQPELFR